MLLFLLACSGPTNGDSASGCFESEWYADGDADGWGAAPLNACEAPLGYVDQPGDCDDADASVNPGTREECDGLDQDCDGTPDDGLSTTPLWPDADGDGFGDASQPGLGCSALPGHVENGDDCDDTNPAVNPAAEEVCNGWDDDCDLRADDDDEVANPTVWVEDSDDDGFGNPETAQAVCAAPSAFHVTESGDCDDRDPEVHPGASETCRDLHDSDCDGYTDDYLGDCVGDPGRIPRVGCGIGPGDLRDCDEGVAAFLPSGEGFPTVQEAIDAAVNGDRVTVCPGTWAENLTLGATTLNLAGFGSDVSRLTSAGPTPIMNLGTGGALSVYGIGFERATAGAITGNDAHLCVEAGSFEGNTGEFGVALYLAGNGTLVLTDTRFEGNYASGGGTASVSGYEASLVRVDFTDNDGGHALSFDVGTDAVVLASTFQNNTSEYAGGTLSFDGGASDRLEIVECSFEGNTSEQDGGAVAVTTGWSDDEGAFTAFVASSFVGNTSDSSGGAVDFAGQGPLDAHIVDSEFHGNEAQDGGSLHWSSKESWTMIIDRTTFEANVVSGYGGAFFFEAYQTADWVSQITVRNSSVVRNVAHGSQHCCGAVYVDTDNAEFRSEGTDWGAGDSDNDPLDVNWNEWSGEADFICDVDGCR